uniref:Metalloendopeptidase n=1 Tax=Clytia hemisphaerica TaxID=252671 RepID=A0A7M5UV23_9CNID
MMKIFVFLCMIVFIRSHPLNHPGEENPAFDYINDANKDLDKEHFEEGDIVKVQNRAALKKDRGQWPKGIVPYTISTVFSARAKDKIRASVNKIQKAAPCMNFVEYGYRASNVPKNHVEVIRSGGCWSMVGMTGGRQSLSIGNGCLWEGTIIHEFLHAIGFYHEQSRPDRDEYVNIIFRNIVEGREHNFKIASRINSLGVGYDPFSVMHFSKGAFSNGNGNTIEWKANPDLSLGGNKLSEKDIMQINLKYCGDVKPTITTTRTTKKRTTTTRTKTTTKRPKTTKTTKMTTTTQRPGKACGDRMGACIAVQFNKGLCRSYNKYYCPRSCGSCKGPESEKCMNLKDTRYDCQSRAKRGECQSRYRSQRSIIHKRRMKTQCPRVCCDRGELYRRPQ